jgi:inorganic pyrophosphatase
MARDLKRIPHKLADGTCRAVVESPSGRRSKFAYEAESDAFLLKMILPTGMSFPLDFGFVPSTRAEDGDPLDVLILSDEPGAVGTIVEVRLIGVVEAEQTEDGKTERNDRLIAVASNSYNHGDVKSLSDLSDNLLKEIEHFFVSYNEVKGKEFKPIRRVSPERARELVESGRKTREQEDED